MCECTLRPMYDQVGNNTDTCSVIEDTFYCYSAFWHMLLSYASYLSTGTVYFNICLVPSVGEKYL